MQKQELLIRASIFYNKSRWHYLIRHCIMPLLADLQKNNLAILFFVSFSSRQGDHIRFAVAVPQHTAKKLSARLDGYIRKFLAQRPSPALLQNFSLTGFFMYLPNNSLKYNLYKISDDTDQRNTIIQYEVSRAIIRAFNSEPVSPASRFSFIIYSQAAIIKAIYPGKKGAAKALKMLLFHYTAELSRDQAAGLENKTAILFEKNKFVLEDIIKDVWQNNGSYSADLKWLDGIENLAKHDFVRTELFMETFIALNHMLHKHTDMLNAVSMQTSVNLLAKIFI